MPQSFLKVLLLLFIFLSANPISVRARDILVPDDFDTIGEALEDATDGDTILVKPGTYNERITMKERVALVSYSGDDGNDLVEGPGTKKVLRRAARTVIDGSTIQEPGYLLSFPKDTTAPMKLDGFTLRNMPKYRSGVNLFLVEIRGCSPEVTNNILFGNRSWGAVLATGLGIGMGPPLETVAQPLLRNNVIYDNDGPGISNGPNSAALIMDNEIFDHARPGATDDDDDAPGIGIREYARPIIENNVCYRNGSGVGGINLQSNPAPLIIRNNILFDNRRGGIGLRGIGGANSKIDAIIVNNQIYANLKAGIRLSKLDTVEISYNTVSDNLKAGIAFFNVAQALVEDNEVSGNMATGIRLLNVPAATLRRNHVHHNVTSGIDVIGWSNE